MKFGLFGGASAQSGEHATDSMLGHRDYVDYVCEAERLGYHSAFVVEHHFRGSGQISASLMLLAYIAARTTRLRLGAGVVVLPWHNPVLVAEQVGTLDQLSGGRFDFGVGKGYRPSEFDGFCMSREEAAARYTESLALMRRAWTSDQRFSHTGTYWAFHDIAIDPPPVQKPHPPIWVGGAHTETIRRAGLEGFHLLLDQIATFDLLEERVATYRAAVAEAGRVFDPMSIAVSRAMHVVKTESEWHEAHRLRAEVLENLRKLGAPPAVPSLDLKTFSDTAQTTDEAALIGYPDEILAKLKRLRAIGIEYVLLADVIGSQESLGVFAREIMAPLDAAQVESPVERLAARA